MARRQRLLADQAVIGVLHGRMEFGPRALEAVDSAIRVGEDAVRTNLKIKFRESFRPFAPWPLDEHVADYFELDCESPYTPPVVNPRHVPQGDECLVEIHQWVNRPRSDLPAITHVDYSGAGPDGERPGPVLPCPAARLPRLTGLRGAHQHQLQRAR